MLSKEHIDLLVAVIIQGPRGVRPGIYHAPYFNHETTNQSHANAIGEMLVKENLSSIHARYPDTITDPDNTPGPFNQYWLAPYEYQERHYRMAVAEAFSAISCYEYQSCEHDEWEQSDASKFCDALRHSLARCIHGYSDAPWEWTQDQIDKARVRA